MHMRPRCSEAIWKASIEKLVSQEACTREGLHWSLHPDLVAKTKGTRRAACDPKDVLKRRFQAQFQERIWVRCFFPEPVHGGNSNAGNVATSFSELCHLCWHPSDTRISLGQLVGASQGNQQFWYPKHWRLWKKCKDYLWPLDGHFWQANDCQHSSLSGSWSAVLEVGPRRSTGSLGHLDWKINWKVQPGCEEDKLQLCRKDFSWKYPSKHPDETVLGGRSSLAQFCRYLLSAASR